jgi:hypothetical protein
LYMTIQWTFLPSLVQICFVVSEKKMKMWNSHRVQCWTKSSHGGHLEFPIGKRFTSLVQDHPMIIPAKSQSNWLSGFWQEYFFKFQPMRTHYGTWQPCWISNQHQKHKSGREPSNEHFWHVWLKSVQRFQRRRFKCEKLTDDDGRLPMTKAHMAYGQVS